MVCKLKITRLRVWNWIGQIELRLQFQIHTEMENKLCFKYFVLINSGMIKLENKENQLKVKFGRVFCERSNRISMTLTRWI
jgi:hypothetical protein